MSELVIKEKEIVVPGEVLARGMDYLPGFGTYRENDEIRASRLGLATISGRAIKLVPLSGRYLPKRHDTIIGKIIDVTLNGWRVDINSAYSAMLMLKEGSSDFIARGADLTQYYALGEYIVAKITQVTTQKLVDLTMKGPGLRKLSNGRIIKVSPSKVPRIIGKQGSMVTMIKKATNCRIIVGQNGLIWLQGEPKDEIFAIQVIKKIQNESHISGLTDKIKAYLEEKTGRKIEMAARNEGDSQ